MIAIAFLFFGILSSCGDEDTNADDPSDTTEIVDIDVVDEVVADFSAGQAIYEGKGMCQTCHMANGEGVEGTFPPLANSDFLTSIDKEFFIKMIMSGSDEPITVNGTEYPGKIMGATMGAVTLTDQEIVDVANFVSDKWGNKTVFTIDDVKTSKE